MSIVLTGMRGAGKSSLGVAVAARLGRGFVDVDHHLEAQWGCKVIEVCQSDAATPWPRGQSALTVMMSTYHVRDAVPATHPKDVPGDAVDM
jgi:predicted ATPase